MHIGMLPLQKTRKPPAGTLSNHAAGPLSFRVVQQKRRVIHLLNRTNLGGPTLIAGYLVHQLRDRYETSLLSGQIDDSEASSEYMIDQFGIKPVYIQNMQREVSLGKDRKAYNEIASIIREFKPHVVHTHASKAGFLGRAAAWRNNVPVIVHTFHGHIFHSYFGKAKTRVFLELERFLAKKSNAIIAISETQKAELCDTFNICPHDKMKVIPLGLDLERFQDADNSKRSKFRNHWQIQDDQTAVVHVGRIVPVKNHLLFLDVLKKTRDRGHTNLRGYIVGDGEDRQIVEDYAGQIGLEFATGPDSKAPLTFTSWIREVDEVMAAADLVALTSRNEGTPLTLIEGQASGTPVISTNVGGVRDIMLDGKTGLLVPPSDAESYTNALCTMLENPCQLAEFGRTAKSFAFEQFSLEKMADRTSNLYEELLT